MDAVSSKPKRAMRVATMFTGIAACTVGLTYGGTAAEAATHTAVHTPKGTDLQGQPAGRSTGSIREVRSCGSNTWLHVLSQNSASHCYGFKGTYVTSSEVGVYAQCGGNNKGWLSWANGDKFTTFGHGTTYRILNWAHLSKVHISGWSGNDTCYAVYTN
jgi:hypothetical protein